MEVVEGELALHWRPSHICRRRPACAAATIPEEQLLPEHGVEDDKHDDGREPAPRAAEEIRATVGAEEIAEISGGGPWIAGTIDHTATRATKSSAHHHTLPPTRPVFGSRGGRSQSASRTRNHSSAPSSRLRRISTSTNCQISPTVRRNGNAAVSGSSPPSRSASQGATTPCQEAHRDGRSGPHHKDLE